MDVQTSSKHTASVNVQADVNVFPDSVPNPSIPARRLIVQATSDDSPEAAVDAIRQFALDLLRAVDQ